MSANFPSIPEEDRVFLVDGTATSDTSVVTCAGYAEAPDAASSRIYVNFGDWWGSHEVSEDFMTSVAYREGVLYAIGKNGLVKVVGQPGVLFTRESIKGKFRSFRIESSEDYGHLSKVRATPSGFVVCGWGGQVYRLSGDTWASLTSENDNLADYDLLDIDGTASGELYAVGLGGAMLHFDGRSWSVEDIPTNRHFNAIRCLSNGTVLLAGAKGALYSGYHGCWQEIATEIDGNFWAIEEFNGAAYLSYAERQLYRLVSGKLEEVMLGTMAHTYRLSAGPSTLLSIGSDALLRFNGVSWNQIDCPDLS